MLIAGPGQGKSTLTHYLAQRHRAAVLEDHREALDEDARAILSALREPPVAPPALPAIAEVCLPARIELPAFSSWMQREHGGNPHGAIFDHLREEIVGEDEPVDADDMRELLGSAPWVLIFDALDEVTSAADHAKVVAAIQALRADLCACSARFILVVTTRPQNYGDQLARDFSTRYLRPLTRDRGLAHAAVLLALFHDDEPERQREAMEQFRAAYADPMVERSRMFCVTSACSCRPSASARARPRPCCEARSSSG